MNVSKAHSLALLVELLVKIVLVPTHVPVILATLEMDLFVLVSSGTFSLIKCFSFCCKILYIFNFLLVRFGEKFKENNFDFFS
jgi:hypothetical protein